MSPLRTLHTGLMIRSAKNLQIRWGKKLPRRIELVERAAQAAEVTLAPVARKRTGKYPGPVEVDQQHGGRVYSHPNEDIGQVEIRMHDPHLLQLRDGLGHRHYQRL